MRKNDIKIILNDDLLAAVLKIDKMSLQGLYKGYVTFDNGEIINSTVWFRLLRVFVREICKVENISYDYREKIIILWKKIGLDFIPNRLFEDLKQEERIAIVSIISELVVNWPENILTLLGREIDFFGVTKPRRFPYVLAKYIDFPMHRYLEVKYNKEFYLRCMDLRIEGWWDEFRYHLNLSKENRKNFSKYLCDCLKIEEKISLNIIKNIFAKKPCHSLIFMIADLFVKNNFQFSSIIRPEEIYPGKERIPREVSK